SAPPGSSPAGPLHRRQRAAPSLRPGARVTVLVVDDSAAVRTRLARMLAEQGGLAVEEAADVGSALASLGQARPDAIVLDIRLGDESGLQILQAVKAAPAPPLVIMLTNHP